MASVCSGKLLGTLLINFQVSIDPQSHLRGHLRGPGGLIRYPGLGALRGPCHPPTGPPNPGYLMGPPWPLRCPWGDSVYQSTLERWLLVHVVTFLSILGLSEEFKSKMDSKTQFWTVSVTLVRESWISRVRIDSADHILCKETFQ